MAVAEALLEADPAAVLRYVGRSGGPEAVLVPRAGLEFVGLSLGSMGSSPLTATPRLLTRLPLAYRQAARELARFRPQVVLATGGYVSAPLVLAARRRRLPVVLLEQNRLPGRAVRYLAQFASAVAVSFPDTGKLLPGSRSVFTGNPVRSVFTGPPRPLPGTASVLVMGGSQGARHLNQVLLGALPRLLEAIPQMKVTHLTGAGDHPRVLAEARALGLGGDPRYQPLAFSDSVAELAAAADLVVMRAGGSSLAEMACLGRPLLLVPYPHAGNHQLANATAFVEGGAALLIEDHLLTTEGLGEALGLVLRDDARRAEMAAAAAALAHPLAAAEVATLLRSLAPAA